MFQRNILCAAAIITTRSEGAQIAKFCFSCPQNVSPGQLTLERIRHVAVPLLPNRVSAFQNYTEFLNSLSIYLIYFALYL